MYLFFNCLSPGLIHPFWKFPMNCFMMGSWWHVQMRSAPTSTVPGSTFPKEYDLLSSCLVSVSKVTAVLFPGDLPNNVWFVFSRDFLWFSMECLGRMRGSLTAPPFLTSLKSKSLLTTWRSCSWHRPRRASLESPPEILASLPPYRKQVETTLGTAHNSHDTPIKSRMVCIIILLFVGFDFVGWEDQKGHQIRRRPGKAHVHWRAQS